MRLIASPLALDIVLALSQRRDGARLAELARATGAPLTAVQVAARLLVEDGIAARDAGPRPRYRLRLEHRASGSVLDLAARVPVLQRAVDIVLRTNPAIEFAARDRDGYIAVESPLADPREVALLDEALVRIGSTLPIERVAHRDLIDRLRDDDAPRRRAQHAAIVKGTLTRSFPSRRRRGGRSQSLRLPSRRAFARLANEAGVAQIRVFGSAARGALRDGSDIDVIVEPTPGRDLSLLDLARLEGALEDIFDRHVDLVTPGGLREDVRQRAAREAVTLYG